MQLLLNPENRGKNMKFVVTKVSSNNLKAFLKESDLMNREFKVRNFVDMPDTIQNTFGGLISKKKMSEIEDISVWLFGKANMDHPIYSVKITMKLKAKATRITLALDRKYSWFGKLINRIKKYCDNFRAGMAQ